MTSVQHTADAALTEIGAMNEAMASALPDSVEGLQALDEGLQRIDALCGDDPEVGVSCAQVARALLAVRQDSESIPNREQLHRVLEELARELRAMRDRAQLLAG